VNARQSICNFRSAVFFLSFGAALVLTSAASVAQPATWKPDSNVEIVVPSGPGSGLDATARSLQAVMQSSKLFFQPTTVVNKAGGGGTLAYLYINQRPGNGHLLSVTSPGIITNKVVGSTDIDYRDVTPLAQLYDENIAFMVLPNSPIKSAQDLIEKLKKDPASLSFGIATVLGGANHIAAASALKAAGVDVARMRNVVFKSGGEVTTALGCSADFCPCSGAASSGWKNTCHRRLVSAAAFRRACLCTHLARARRRLHLFFVARRRGTEGAAPRSYCLLGYVVCAADCPR
jgi:putative tricarboxylic transport membrane protein